MVVERVVDLVVGDRTYLFVFECAGFDCEGSGVLDLINLLVGSWVVELLA